MSSGHRILRTISLDVRDYLCIGSGDLLTRPADGVELMFVAIGFITVPIAVIVYTAINNKRNRSMLDGEIDLTVDEIRRLGDRYPGFRYML